MEHIRSVGHGGILRALWLITIIMALCAVTAGQAGVTEEAARKADPSPYRLSGENGHSQTIAPRPEPWPEPSDFLLRFVSSETQKTITPKKPVGEIEEFVEDGNSTVHEYLGPFGTTIPLSEGSHELWFSFPTGPSLSLTLEIRGREIKSLDGYYWPACGENPTIAWSSYHLEKRLRAIRNGDVSRANGVAIIDLPNPNTTEPDPENPHPKGVTIFCDLSYLIPRYHDLKIETKPRGALVYVSNEFQGKADGILALKVAHSPANLLIKLSGYIDVAKQLELHDGPNELTIVLKPAKP